MDGEVDGWCSQVARSGGRVARPVSNGMRLAREGDEVVLNGPEGREEIEILSVEYIRID